MSEAWEVDTGKRYYPLQQQAGGGKYVIDPQLTRYVQNIGNSLVVHSTRSHLPYEFVVLNDSTPNAWALPGGKIAINRGLLIQLKDEAELAAVLAHEIVHADARHSAQSQEMGSILSVGTMAANVLLSRAGVENEHLQQGIAYGGLYGQQRYSRSRELLADSYGMRYMSAAGYDPMGAVELQKTFLRLSSGQSRDLFSTLFASHPPSQQRVAANLKEAAALPAGGKRNLSAFKRQLANLYRRQPGYDYADKAAEAIANSDYKQALSLADKAIAVEKNESLFHEARGAALAGLNRSRDAISALDTAVQLNPGYYAPLLRRGILRHELKSYRLAEKDLKASLALAPTQVAYVKLGEISEQNNDCQAAAQYYEQAARQSDRNRESLQQKLSALQTSCR